MRDFLLNHWDTALLIAVVWCVVWLVSLRTPKVTDLCHCPRCNYINHIHTRGNTVYECEQGQYVVVWCTNCKHCYSVHTFDGERTRLSPPKVMFPEQGHSANGHRYSM